MRQVKYAVYVTADPSCAPAHAHAHDPAALDDLGHELAMRLRAAYAHLRRQSNRVFSAFGMTSDQYVLLSVLARQGTATQEQLTVRCSSDTATIGAMVALLEAKRFVTRTPHPEDGRAWRVKLTGSGEALVEQMRRSSSELRIHLARLFAPGELQTLIGSLERMAGALRPLRRKAPARIGATRGTGMARRRSRTISNAYETHPHPRNP